MLPIGVLVGKKEANKWVQKFMPNEKGWRGTPTYVIAFCRCRCAPPFVFIPNKFLRSLIILNTQVKSVFFESVDLTIHFRYGL